MRKRLLALALSAALLVVLCAPATQAASTEGDRPIDQPYVYPVQPETEEWNAASLEGWAALRELCAVDEALMERMTTPALMETVLTYPLLTDIYAFNSIEQGIETVSKHFKGIELLFAREDAAACLAKYLETEEYLSTDADIYQRVTYGFAELFLRMLSEKETMEDGPEGIAPRAIVSTPAGNPVRTEYGLTWADHGVTYERVKEAQEEYKKKHPEITIVTDPNPSYNCHSYAWYSTSTSNKHWINDPSPYLTDGSYTKQPSAMVGYKVHWTTGDHSGIVQTMAGGPNNPTIISKWGRMGVIIHPLKTCPYEGEVTYWKR